MAELFQQLQLILLPFVIVLWLGLTVELLLPDLEDDDA